MQFTCLTPAPNKIEEIFVHHEDQKFNGRMTIFYMSDNISDLRKTERALKRKLSWHCMIQMWLQPTIPIIQQNWFIVDERDPGRSVEWGLGSQFCQPILLQTKWTGFNNGVILHVGKILLYYMKILIEKYGLYFKIIL